MPRAWTWKVPKGRCTSAPSGRVHGPAAESRAEASEIGAACRLDSTPPRAAASRSGWSASARPTPDGPASGLERRARRTGELSLGLGAPPPGPEPHPPLRLLPHQSRWPYGRPALSTGPRPAFRYARPSAGPSPTPRAPVPPPRSGRIGAHGRFQLAQGLPIRPAPPTTAREGAPTLGLQASAKAGEPPTGTLTVGRWR